LPKKDRGRTYHVRKPLKTLHNQSIMRIQTAALDIQGRPTRLQRWRQMVPVEIGRGGGGKQKGFRGGGHRYITSTPSKRTEITRGKKKGLPKFKKEKRLQD